MKKEKMFSLPKKILILIKKRCCGSGSRSGQNYLLSRIQILSTEEYKITRTRKRYHIHQNTSKTFLETLFNP